MPIIQKAAEHILKIALVSQATAEGEEIMQEVFVGVLVMFI